MDLRNIQACILLQLSPVSHIRHVLYDFQNAFELSSNPADIRFNAHPAVKTGPPLPPTTRTPASCNIEPTRTTATTANNHGDGDYLVSDDAGPNAAQRRGQPGQLTLRASLLLCVLILLAFE